MTNRIVVKRLGKIIDVFTGEQGWEPEHWTRFLLVNNYLKFIKGSQMSPQDFNDIKKQLGISFA